MVIEVLWNLGVFVLILINSRFGTEPMIYDVLYVTNSSHIYGFDFFSLLCHVALRWMSLKWSHSVASSLQSSRIWNTWLVRDDQQIQTKVVATSLIIFGTHTNIVFIIKVKILVLIKCSYKFSQSCWLLSLEWLSYFEHIFQSHSNTYHSNGCC